MRLHVLVKKEELDGQRLPGKVVVVLDVLFATTTIAAALGHGARAVLPERDGDAARAAAAGMPAGSYVLAGEYGAETLPGFGHPTPLAVLSGPIDGRTLVYATTNGTVALHKAAGASRIYAAALANGAAVGERIAARHGDDTVLLVCSGSMDAVNLEDLYGAGHLVAHLSRLLPGCDLTDAARAALLVQEGRDALGCLASSRVGRMMRERGLAEEVAWAARKDHLAVVPELVRGRLVAS